MRYVAPSRFRYLLILFLLVPLITIVLSACGSDQSEEIQPMGQEVYPNLFLAEASGVPMFNFTGSVSVNDLEVIDIEVGDGASVTLQDTLEVNYLGVGGSSGFSFDSSFARNEPAVFPLQAVILGWQEGLVGMKEGGRRILVIPGNKAYGPTPPPGSGIEPNETLIFLVDLIKIN